MKVFQFLEERKDILVGESSNFAPLLMSVIIKQ